MAAKKRLIVEPRDIRTLRVMCKTCNADVAYPLQDQSKRSISLSEMCPHCGLTWNLQVVGQDASAYSVRVVKHLISYMEMLIKEPDDLPFLIQFEIQG